MTCFLLRSLLVVLMIGFLFLTPVLAQLEVDITSPEISQDELEAIPVAIEGYDVLHIWPAKR